MEMATNDKAYYIKLLIMIGLMFGSLACPPIGGLSQYGTTVVVIFIGIIFGYLNFGMVIPSFMALVALGFSGYNSVSGTLKEALGHSVVIYVFAILILAQTLQDSGVASKLINWLVTLKITKGKPWVLSSMLMVTAYIVSLLVNFVPPCIIIWSMLFELFKTVGYKKGDKWPMIMLAGVLYMSTMGGFVSPFQTGVVGNFGILTAASGGTLTYDPIRYFIWAFICGSVLLALWILFAKYVIKPDVSPLKRDDLFIRDETPLSREQKIVSVIFMIFVVGLLLPSFLPERSFLKAIFVNLDNSGWGLIMVLVAVLVRLKGENIFEFGELFARGVVWDLPIMMGCMFTMATALTDESTGIPAIVVSLIQPLIDNMGLTAFWLFIIFLILLLSNLTNTVAITCIFIPIMYAVASDTGMNLILLTGCINFIGNVCLLSPACCMNSAMLYGKKEWMTNKFCFGFGVFVFVTMYLVMILIGLPLGNLLSYGIYL